MKSYVPYLLHRCVFHSRVSYLNVAEWNEIWRVNEYQTRDLKTPRAKKSCEISSRNRPWLFSPARPRFIVADSFSVLQFLYLSRLYRAAFKIYYSQRDISFSGKRTDQAIWIVLRRIFGVKTNELQRGKRNVNSNWIKRVISTPQWRSNEYEWNRSKKSVSWSPE